MLKLFLEKCNYDKQETEYLIDGFLNGFSAGCLKSDSAVDCENLKSALEMPEIVSDKICKELKAGRLAGPFLTKPCTNFHASPIGLCPKKEPNKYRLIFHLSYPHGNSVNDFIPLDFSSVQYTKISDAIDGIKKFETPFLAKTDVSAAFRNLPLRPQEYHLFGFRWNNLYYMDRCLTFGCSSSCQIFERFSSSLHFIGQHFMPDGLIFHILDDFLIVAPDSRSCEVYLQNFLTICKCIGLPMAKDKTVGPASCLIFLGIELDTVNKVARLPSDKLEKCLNLVREFLHQKKVTLRELQSLCGLLNFACQVVVPGRAFLRRMFDLCKGVKQPHHRIKLSRHVKEDLKVWENFLIQFNGKCFFLNDKVVSSDSLHLFTDASGALGYGAVFQQSWFFGLWDKNWLEMSITIKELYPIVLAIELWGHKLANKSVCFNCDNEALVFILNKQTSKERQLMFLVRKLVLLSLKHNILFIARHIPGKFNILSDALSRLQVHKFKILFPEADEQSTDIPGLPALPV